MLNVLHVICTRLRPGYSSICFGDSSRHCEEIVKNLELHLWMQLLLLLLLHRMGLGLHSLQKESRGCNPCSHAGIKLQTHQLDLSPLTLTNEVNIAWCLKTVAKLYQLGCGPLFPSLKFIPSFHFSVNYSSRSSTCVCSRNPFPTFD